MEAKMEAVRQIINCGARLRQSGLIVATQGNISLRRSDGTILITRSAVDKGELSREDILPLGPGGNQLTRGKTPSSETALHLAIYQHFPATGAVVHAHPPNATAFAASGKSMPHGILAEIEQELGSIPLLPWRPPGSRELGEIVTTCTGKPKAILLANHGALTLGDNLEQACYRMELLEFYASVLLKADRLGGVEPLPDGHSA